MQPPGLFGSHPPRLVVTVNCTRHGAAPGPLREPPRGATTTPPLTYMTIQHHKNIKISANIEKHVGMVRVYEGTQARVAARSAALSNMNIIYQMLRMPIRFVNPANRG